jgi:DNA repair protein RecN (Recombination protein N)
MLRRLSIRDVVLIDHLELEFNKGLSVLTGETGAGKSILLDSLGLALGNRADVDLIRPGAKQAVVAATFEIDNNHSLNNLLTEHGLSPEDGLVIMRRVVGIDGRSRAFINDQATTVTLLREISDHLIEIQGQFDRFSLASSSVQLTALDLYGNLTASTIKVKKLYHHWSKTVSDLREVEEKISLIRSEEEQLRHDLAELNDLSPFLGEEVTLSNERQLLQNSERLIDGFNQVIEDLAGDTGAEPALQRSLKLLVRMAEFSGGRVDKIISTLENSAAEISDSMQDLQSLAQVIETNSAHLETIENRLFSLRAAARKYNTKIDDLDKVRDKLIEKIAILDDNSQLFKTLKNYAEAARQSFLKKSKVLSNKRIKAAISLDKEISQELVPLKLDNTIFNSNITILSEPSWSETGIDTVEFLIATNPGSIPGTIGKIASGGELSRILLALKVVLTGTSNVATLIFDEVDAGVGGATAAAVGERLSSLSNSSGPQILVVTHSPQVAAVGHCHWRVSKESINNKPLTRVILLNQKDRTEEIARMLSGAKITKEARAAATRLLHDSGRKINSPSTNPN